MSIEKFIALYFPFKANNLCTTKMAKITSGIIALILTLYNLQYVILYKVYKYNNGVEYCAIPNLTYLAILDRIDSVLYSFGTFVIMLLVNIAIITKFVKPKCRNSEPNYTTESTTQSLNKYAARGTAMVVTVSLTFIVLTAPVAMDQASKKRLSRDQIYHAFQIILRYLNHSINGVLYCIVGSKFRKELLKLLCCKRSDSENVLSRSTSVSVSRFWRCGLELMIINNLTFYSLMLCLYICTYADVNVNIIMLINGNKNTICKNLILPQYIYSWE